MEFADQVAALQALQKEERARTESLEKELASSRTNLERIDTAIAALQGQAQPTRAKRNQLPACTKEDVLAVLRTQDFSQPKPEAELNQLVRQQVKRRGRRLTGFGLLYEHALKAAGLAVVNGMVEQLRSESPFGEERAS